MSLPDFIDAWRYGELDKYASWRAYDIPASVKPHYVQFALKATGYDYAGEHALRTFAAHRGLDPAEVGAILGAWWVWSRVEAGRRLRGLVRRPPGYTPTGTPTSAVLGRPGG